MDKKILTSALAGAIASFLIGWLVFGIALHGYYMENSKPYEGLMKKMPVLWGIFAGGLIWSWLLAYIFNKWAHINTFLCDLENYVINEKSKQSKFSLISVLAHSD